MTVAQITTRIAQLKAELEQVVAEANRQIGMRQGAIAELERWLAELGKTEQQSPL